jgi:hypothetical protein
MSTWSTTWQTLARCPAASGAAQHKNVTAFRTTCTTDSWCSASPARTSLSSTVWPWNTSRCMDDTIPHRGCNKTHQVTKLSQVMPSSLYFNGAFTAHGTDLEGIFQARNRIEVATRYVDNNAAQQSTHDVYYLWRNIS